MKAQAPFLEVRSFVTEEINQDALETTAPPSTPFLSLYESEEGGAWVDPETEEHVAFLNELYDEEFDEALCALVDEAAAIYEAQFPYEQEDPRTVWYQAERLLTQHFAPLVAEAEAMFTALAREFSQRDPNVLSENEIETIVDRCRPSAELTPTFEEFFGKLKKLAKNVAKKAVGLAKKGVQFAAKLGLGPILNKLKALIKPLLQRVIQTAIGKLPPHLQPIAQKLAERLPFLKKPQESGGAVAEPAEPASEPAAEPGTEPSEPSQVADIQSEFHHEVTNLLFARTEVEQDLEVARVLTERPVPDT